jgi:hypothetical protein
MTMLLERLKSQILFFDPAPSTLQKVLTFSMVSLYISQKNSSYLYWSHIYNLLTWRVYGSQH